jgi:hypothetical protein
MSNFRSVSKSAQYESNKSPNEAVHLSRRSYDNADFDDDSAEEYDAAFDDDGKEDACNKNMTLMSVMVITATAIMFAIRRHLCYVSSSGAETERAGLTILVDFLSSSFEVVLICSRNMISQ